MHISEGVLSPVVLGTGYALALTATSIALRKTDYSKLTTAAVLASFFFIASLIHIPVGPGSVHLILNGLLGLFLGWLVFPVMLVVLLLQAILFQFGGIAVLGINTLNMAFPALICHYLFRPFLNKSNWLCISCAFGCGAFSVAGAALCTALSLELSNDHFLGVAKLILLAHLPIIFLEGLITALIVAFIKKSRPELLFFYQPKKGNR